MAATNSVIIECICPSCKKLSRIECQFHVASSFDGLFCAKIYNVGDKLPWFDRDNELYISWKNLDNQDVIEMNGHIIERCFSMCQSCLVDLFVDIHFFDLTIIGFNNVSVRPDLNFSSKL